MKKLNNFTSGRQIQQWQQGSQFQQKSKRFLSKIHQKEKKNSLSYIQSQNNKRKSRPMSSPSPSHNQSSTFFISQSINQLRHLQTSQRYKTQKISNRLKYIQTSTDRQQALMTTARQKFNKINQIRQQSFLQKSFLSKQRQKLLYEHSKSVYFQAKKIKNQKVKNSQSLKRIVNQKHNQAQQVKKQRQINESIIKQRKQQQKQLRTTKVLKVQQEQHVARQRSKSRSQQKLQSGIQNHKKAILFQFQKVQHQLKFNSKLMESFQSKAMKIYDKKIKHQQELQRYRSFLKLQKSIENTNNTTLKKNQKTSISTVKKQSNQNQEGDKSSKIGYIRNSYSNKNQFYLTNPEEDEE